jgi:hypothetical protein
VGEEHFCHEDLEIISRNVHRDRQVEVAWSLKCLAPVRDEVGEGAHLWVIWSSAKYYTQLLSKVHGTL